MSILKVGMYASSRIGANQNYLTFSSDNPFSISFANKRWDGVLEYSPDAENWYEWDASEINSADNTLYLRGRGNTVITNGANATHAMIMTSESGVSCTGNIMSLLDHGSPETAVMGVRCFARMFQGCTNLTVAPELSAAGLAERCYEYMLHSCTSLEVAPELPATVLAERCYAFMFNTSSIAISLTQTGNYQTPWRIPTTGTGTTATDWNIGMLTGTGGTFKSNPSINTTYYQAN